MINNSKGTSLVTSRIDLLKSEYNYQVEYYVEDLYTTEGSSSGTVVHLHIPIHTKNNPV